MSIYRLRKMSKNQLPEKEHASPADRETHGGSRLDATPLLTLSKQWQRKAEILRWRSKKDDFNGDNRESLKKQIAAGTLELCAKELKAKILS